MTVGKVVIVTGASRGIGLAVARFLVSTDANNKLLLVSRSLPNDDLIKKGVDEGRVKLVELDLSDIEKTGEVVKTAVNEFGRLDGIVLNHGSLSPVERIGIEGGNVDEWRKAFDINFFSALSIAQTALPYLRKSKGRIVFTSSGAATSAYTAWGAYGATKAAMNHLTMTLGVEEPDVVSIAIRPGTVDTEMQRELREVHHESMDSQDAAKFASLKTEGKLLRPDQPGNVIAKLVLDAPTSLSGKFLTWNDQTLSAFQDSP